MEDEYDFILKPENFGYKEFKADGLHRDAKHCWQKCVVSEDTKLYFITIYEYIFSIHGEVFHNYEADTQLYQKGTRCAMNISFLQGWTIEDMENQISTIYNSGNFEPYED